jgi:hypothetical protein
LRQLYKQSPGAARRLEYTAHPAFGMQVKATHQEIALEPATYPEHEIVVLRIVVDCFSNGRRHKPLLLWARLIKFRGGKTFSPMAV